MSRFILVNAVLVRVQGAGVNSPFHLGNGALILVVVESPVLGRWFFLQREYSGWGNYSGCEEDRDTIYNIEHRHM